MKEGAMPKRTKRIRYRWELMAISDRLCAHIAEDVKDELKFCLCKQRQWEELHVLFVTYIVLFSGAECWTQGLTYRHVNTRGGTLLDPGFIYLVHKRKTCFKNTALRWRCPLNRYLLQWFWIPTLSYKVSLKLGFKWSLNKRIHWYIIVHLG